MAGRFRRAVAVSTPEPVPRRSFPITGDVIVMAESRVG